MLLDEVMAGLTPTEVAQMLDTLRRAARQRAGSTLLVIEHVMRALMELCARIVVLHHGELHRAKARPKRSVATQRVLSVYFGDARA